MEIDKRINGGEKQIWIHMGLSQRLLKLIPDSTESNTFPFYKFSFSTWLQKSETQKPPLYFPLKPNNQSLTKPNIPQTQRVARQ